MFAFKSIKNIENMAYVVEHFHEPNPTMSQFLKSLRSSKTEPCTLTGYGGVEELFLWPKMWYNNNIVS